MCKAAKELFRQDVRHIVCVTSECENWQKKRCQHSVECRKNILDVRTIFGHSKNEYMST